VRCGLYVCGYSLQQLTGRTNISHCKHFPLCRTEERPYPKAPDFFIVRYFLGKYNLAHHPLIMECTQSTSKNIKEAFLYKLDAFSMCKLITRIFIKVNFFASIDSTGKNVKQRKYLVVPNFFMH